MPRVRLRHWKAVEAASLIRRLNNGGCCVEYDEKFTPSLLKQWREPPPDFFVIDLSRLPSQGRDIAVALRQSPRTRHVPLIFCSGSEAKVEGLKTVLPDAVYCPEASLLEAIKAAGPIPGAVRPKHMMDRYVDRTAAEKLGIKENGTILVLHPPPDCLSSACCPTALRLWIRTAT